MIRRIGLAPFCDLCEPLFFFAGENRTAGSESGGFVCLPWVTACEVHEFLGDFRRPLVRHVDRRRRPVLYVP